MILPGIRIFCVLLHFIIDFGKIKIWGVANNAEIKTDNNLSAPADSLQDQHLPFPPHQSPMPVWE